MAKLYVFSVSELERKGILDAVNGEVKCGSCGWTTSSLYVLADNEEEALKLINEGIGLCGECMAEMIAQDKYEIAIQ